MAYLSLQTHPEVCFANFSGSQSNETDKTTTHPFSVYLSEVFLIFHIVAISAQVLAHGSLGGSWTQDNPCTEDDSHLL